jgi:hypothetical protein
MDEKEQQDLMARRNVLKQLVDVADKETLQHMLKVHTEIDFAHSRAQIQRQLAEAEAKLGTKVNQIAEDMRQYDEDHDELFLAKRIFALPEVQELCASKASYEYMLTEIGELVTWLVEAGLIDQVTRENHRD